jgi:hypothetical protein
VAPFPHLLQLLIHEVDAELLEAVGEEDFKAWSQKKNQYETGRGEALAGRMTIHPCPRIYLVSVFVPSFASLI